MVLRHDDDGVLAVGQASHAWLCGQFARAWGNARFGAVEPLDEVALGAEQHDVGMARWDLDPARHAETGLPKSFMEMGAQANARLWSRGPQRLVSQSRYAALLAIGHGRRLYESFDVDGASPGDADAARSRFARQTADSIGGRPAEPRGSTLGMRVSHALSPQAGRRLRGARSAVRRRRRRASHPLSYPGQ